MISIVIMIIGAVLLVWFLLPFFSNRILNIGNLTGIGVSLVLLFYGIFFQQVNGFLARFWQRGIGKAVEIVIGLCILVILVLAVMTMVCMGRGMAAGAETKNLLERSSATYAPAAATGETNAAGSSNAAASGGTFIGDRTTGKDGSAIPNTGAGSKTVIILGCKVRGTAPSLMLQERLETGYQYLLSHPEANVIVSGGQGEDEEIAEGEVMYQWLKERGISESRMIKETASTDTHENLVNCYEILTTETGCAGGIQPETDQKDELQTRFGQKDEQTFGIGQMNVQQTVESNTDYNPSKPLTSDYTQTGLYGTAKTHRWATDVIIVTNEFHEYRAVKIAGEVGFRAEPLPARTAWWLFPTYYVREMYGILEDWFLV